MTDSPWSRCGKSITRPARRAGFSLVEVLVVLAILGILATISGMALSSYMARADLKRAARTVVSLCQTARIEAIKRNRSTAVVFNNATNTCSVYTANGDGNWATEADNTLMRRFSISGSRSPITVTNATASTYIFNSRGRSTLGSITLLNSANTRSLTITIRSTGSIIVQ